MLGKILEYLKNTRLSKTNYKGEPVITGGGLFFICGSIVIWVLYQLNRIGDQVILQQLIFLVSIIGAVGYIDDLAGGKEYQGFKGHLKSVLEGQLTTGLLKALISLVAVFLVINIEKINIYHKITNLLVILLMTNLINLFDLRPGRALKFFLILSVPLFVQGNFFLYLLPVFLIMTVYLSLELQGKVMLGDTGSNTLGAILGIGYIKTFSIINKIFLLVFLLFLNIAAERISFSGVIQKNRYLRWFDHLGRKD